ncbi:hypothetical protein M885DRAFT_609280 [Pelagophyceae sp. CCMP2097]|nr:hypothetical protein M885DRAFT_609280 [Pelagophyceae sp. CCMP2097]
MQSLVACALLARCVLGSLPSAILINERSGEVLQEFQFAQQQLFDLTIAKYETSQGTPSAVSPVDLSFGIEADGSYMAYVENATDRGNFQLQLLYGWLCPWNYTNDCSSEVPCEDGLASQPQCLNYYEANTATGYPDCFGFGQEQLIEVSSFCWFDEPEKNETFDARLQPWYTKAKALATANATAKDTESSTYSRSVRVWSDPYRTDEGFGISATYAFFQGSEFTGVAASAVTLESVEALVSLAAEAYPETHLYITQTESGLLVASSSDNCTVVTANATRFTPGDCGDDLFAAAAAAEALEEEGWQGVVSHQGENFWLLKNVIADDFGLNWTLRTLSPVASGEDVAMEVPEEGRIDIPLPVLDDIL